MTADKEANYQLRRKDTCQKKARLEKITFFSAPLFLVSIDFQGFILQQPWPPARPPPPQHRRPLWPATSAQSACWTCLHPVAARWSLFAARTHSIWVSVVIFSTRIIHSLHLGSCSTCILCMHIYVRTYGTFILYNPHQTD